jgi:transposase
MGITLSQSEEKKPGSRKGRPNYDPVLRERLAAAACEPGVSVAKLAREHGINANMLFAWRRRYRARHQTESAALIPVVVLNDAPAVVAQTLPVEPEGVKPVAPAGTLEIHIGRTVVRVDGVVDADTLRTVLGSLRS